MVYIHISVLVQKLNDAILCNYVKCVNTAVYIVNKL